MIKQFAFKGETPQEALRQAQEEIGTNALVITTKQIREKSLNVDPLYEVIVGIEVPDDYQEENKKVQIDEIKKQVEAYTNYGSRPKHSPDFAAQLSHKKDSSSDISLDISNAAKEISKIANLDAQPKFENNNLSKELTTIQKQMKTMTNEFNVLKDTLWEQNTKQRGINIPSEFATIYKLAKTSGMKEEHLKSIMEATIVNMPNAMRENPIAVKRYFYTFLRKMMPIRKESFSKNRQKIMVLVGPTGVGKTTTLSKLAYRFKSGKYKFDVGIITLDSFRMGAAEQLKQYADIMSVRMLIAYNAQDFIEALQALSHCDLILVDTMGSSQYDMEKLYNLNDVLKQSNANIDVNLVLSAGSKIDDLIEIYDNFAFLEIDTLIITKFDETRIFGNIFSLIYEMKTPVSYFSLGQEVPEDIMEADGDYLVKCILEGFDKGDKNGSSK